MTAQVLQIYNNHMQKTYKWKQMKEKHCKYCKDKGLAWPRLPLIRLLGYYPKRNQSSLLMSKLDELLANQSQSSLGHFFAILGKKMCA